MFLSAEVLQLINDARRALDQGGEALGDAAREGLEVLGGDERLKQLGELTERTEEELPEGRQKAKLCRPLPEDACLGGQLDRPETVEAEKKQ